MTETRKIIEQTMYGMSKKDMEEEMEELVEFYRGDHSMAAAAILSDAQEAMETGDNDTARQFINKAKWLIQKK